MDNCGDEKRPELLRLSMPAAFCRRILPGSLALLLACASFFGPQAEGGDADWRLIRQSTYGDSTYFDASSVKHLEGQVVSLRAKFGAGEYLYEMQCGEKKVRLIEEGAAKGPDEGWFPIVSGSDEDLIYLEVCR